MNKPLLVCALCLGLPLFAQGTMQSAGAKVDNAADATKDATKKAATDSANATKKAASDASTATKHATTKAADSTKKAASKTDAAIQERTAPAPTK